jgi:hypothetical protein
MAGIGAIKGLSFVNDWEKDIDRVYQREEYAAKVKSQKEQETMFYANLMKKGHGSTPYVEGKLNDFYKEHTAKVADFAINNPNFRTDVSKMQEFLDLNDQFLNNPILQQDLQVKGQFEKLQNAYNSKQITKTHFDQEMKKYTDYAYADPKTDAQPYVFADPKQVDINTLIKEGQGITPTIRQIQKKGMQIETYEGVDPTAVMNTATSLLADEDNKIAFQKEYDEAIARNPLIKDTFKSLEQYTVSRIEAGNKLQMVKTEYDDAYLRNLSAGKKEGMPGMYFMKHLYPTLSSLKDGERVNGDLHGLPMTVFNELKAPVTLDPGEAKVMGTNGLQDLAVSINMEATNFTGYMNFGGELYGEVSVDASSSMLSATGDKINNAGKINETKKADEYLTSVGFVAKPGNLPAPMSPASFMGGSTPAKDYTGKVWVKLNMDPSRLVDVDRSYGGQTEVPAASNFYGDPRTKYEVGLLNRNPQLVAEDKAKGIEPFKLVDDPAFLSSHGGNFEYIKVKGKDRDPKTGERYVRSLTDGKVFTY